jgi:NitT/TauT family transport system permease protein
LNIALLISIAVELVAAQKGLGALIWLAWQTLRTEELYVSLAVTATLGIIFNLLLQRISLHLVPWQMEQEI